MKRLFGHSGKKAQKREGRIERTYDWDRGEEEDYGEDFYEEEPWEEEEDCGEEDFDEEEESYGEDPCGEEEPYEEDPCGEEEPYGENLYGEEEPYGENLYGEEEPYGENLYEKEEPYEEDSYGEEEPYGENLYEEEEPYEEDPYEEEESYEEDFYEEEEPYEEDSYVERYYREDEGPYREDLHGEKTAPVRRRGASGGGLFAGIRRGLRGMDVMDRLMAVTGIGVLILAAVTGSVFIRAAVADKQVSGFVEVGAQLSGISMIGERGLLAIADAERAKAAAASDAEEQPEMPETPAPSEEEEGQTPEYEETGYERQVAVRPGLTSIQKDLKIKFINRKTGKLVPNVPFSVTVTDSGGKSALWSDDDMDGIIYKKDLAPGMYKVAMEALTDEKYKDYSLSLEAQSVEVKKEIVYKKVDVSNEVKQESEVDVKKEDTKKAETVVESSLQDTVGWVESRILSVTYEEVNKADIPDPMTLAMGKGILRMSEEAEPTSDPSASPSVSEEPKASPSPSPSASPSPSPSASPSPSPSASLSPSPSASPSPSPSASLSPSPSASPGLEPVKVKVEQAELTGAIGGTLAALAKISGTPEGAEVEYISISSDNAAVASASIDDKGNVTVKCKAVGTAKLTIKANYKGGAEESAGTAELRVTVRGNLEFALDRTSLSLFPQTSASIVATVANASAEQIKVTASSSDEGVASVSVQGSTVTVTGIAEGTATVTVSYVEDAGTVSGTCTVTVQKHPKEDSSTPLKDAAGRQVYVMAGDQYREAVRADYYTADRFYAKAEAKYTGWQTIGGKMYYFTADSTKVTGEQIIQGAKYHFASDGALVVGDGTMGIDVSKWNGSIDWSAVKNSGVSYVIIRSGYRGSATGRLIADPKFEANIRGASAAGLKIGIYFFSQAVDEVEAVEEASMVLEQIKGYTISYPVFFDVEASGGRGDKIDSAMRTAVCRAFCQTIQKEGYTAGVYSNKTWLETKLDPGALSAYKIWLAQYVAAPTYQGRYDLWQYKATGSIGGISGDVDMNISYLGY